MVTRDAVLTIFKECDRDNDGIVWLSEIKQLALSYTSSNEDEVETDQDEDVPLTFDDFLEKFAPQLKDLVTNGDCNGDDSVDGELDHDLNTDIYPDEQRKDGGYKHKHLTSKPLGTSSGISDCSTELPVGGGIAGVTPPDSLQLEPPLGGAAVAPLNYPFSPEEGFEGYGEQSSEEELVIEDKTISAIVDSETKVLSPTGSFRRKNSPFRLSQRRLKRSSAPIITNNDTTVEDELRQDIEELSKKVGRLENDISNERNLVKKLRNEKQELNEKVLHLEEIYRDLDISSKKTERSRNETIQELLDRFEGLKDSMESERVSYSLQLKKYEEEIKHSHEVKDKLTEEVVRLREVWADSQEQEAMWETKYNEMEALSSHREQEILQLHHASEKDRASHENVVKDLHDEIRILNQDLDELNSRKRSDTIIGRLQGKVDRYQEENAQLKEMTEEMLSSRDQEGSDSARGASPLSPRGASPLSPRATLALEIDSASHEELTEAYTAMQKDYAALRSYVDKLLMNIISEAPHLLCVDNSS